MNAATPPSGWERLAQVVAANVPASEIDRIWCFPVTRQGHREFGTAVIARAEGLGAERRTIYTARYMLLVKGKERGRFEADVRQVGSGPVEQLPKLLEEAHRRSDDDEPPSEVDPAQWFAVADEPAVGE